MSRAAAATELHRAPIDPLAVAKEAGIVAGLVFALALAIIGVRIEDVPGGLELIYRVDDVLWAAGLAFVMRTLFVLTRDGWPEYSLYAGLALSVGMLVVLLSGSVFPFEGPVVNWMLWILFVVLTLRAYVVYERRGHVLTAAERESTMDKVAAGVQNATRYFGPVLVVLGLLAPVWVPQLGGLLGLSGLNIGLAVLVMTYIMLGWGLNIVVGLAGLLDLGYVAFYAVGAYSYALLAEHAGMSFWACLPIAGATAALAGVLLGFPVLRLRGDYLAIVTLGFGEMIRLILINWFSLTRGPDGIRGIPSATLPMPDVAWGAIGGIEVPYPTLVPLTFDRFVPEGVIQFHQYFDIAFDPAYKFIFLYYVVFALALVVNLFTLRVRKLPVGRAWEALREDEIACRSLGINPTNTKLTAFGIGAMFGGFAGAFFATRQGSITPESFVFLESAVILAIVVLGGMGSQVGVVVAAVALIGLPEIFRELEEFRLLAFGGSMVLIMIWRPKGLLAHREPTVRLADGDPPEPDPEPAPVRAEAG